MTIWSEYSLTPSEWDNIDKKTQAEMIAKHQLEVERENRRIEEQKNKHN